MFPRNGMCVCQPAAGSWADLGPRRRGGGLSGYPAAASQEETSAAIGRDRRGDLTV